MVGFFFKNVTLDIVKDGVWVTKLGERHFLQWQSTVFKSNSDVMSESLIELLNHQAMHARRCMLAVNHTALRMLVHEGFGWLRSHMTSVSFKSERTKWNSNLRLKINQCLSGDDFMAFNPIKWADLVNRIHPWYGIKVRMRDLVIPTTGAPTVRSFPLEELSYLLYAMELAVVSFKSNTFRHASSLGPKIPVAWATDLCPMWTDPVNEWTTLVACGRGPRSACGGRENQIVMDFAARTMDLFTFHSRVQRSYLAIVRLKWEPGGCFYAFLVALEKYEKVRHIELLWDSPLGCNLVIRLVNNGRSNELSVIQQFEILLKRKRKILYKVYREEEKFHIWVNRKFKNNVLSRSG